MKDVTVHCSSNATRQRRSAAAQDARRSAARCQDADAEKVTHRIQSLQIKPVRMQRVSLLARSSTPLHHLRDALRCSTVCTGPQPLLPERGPRLLPKTAQLASAQARTGQPFSQQLQHIYAQAVRCTTARLCTVPHGMLYHVYIA